MSFLKRCNMSKESVLSQCKFITIAHSDDPMASIQHVDVPKGCHISSDGNVILVTNIEAAKFFDGKRKGGFDISYLDERGRQNKVWVYSAVSVHRTYRPLNKTQTP